MSQTPSGPSDYRIFVGAFPAGDLGDRIQAVRHAHDPVTARITPPHVTLWGTAWRSGPPSAENEAETIRRLERLAGDLPPFTLRLGGVRSFPGPRPVIYLAVALDPSLVHVRRLLMEVLGSDKHRDYTPHLTLAMRLSGPDAAAMLRALQETPWHTLLHPAPITSLQLMQRGPRDPAWRCIQRIPCAEAPA